MERINHKLKAGVYCRVSTQLEIQEGSLAWQRQHYFELLSNDPNIESVQVYCDEGFSGKYADRRPGFQQMLKDCEAGKIDVLYAKSISRFSRNLADCISTVRRLRTLGIPVLFEEEGINTMNIPSELLFHILSIVAQEESNSIGQNMKWSIESRHANGIPTGKVTYGYRRENDTWRIEESEARRVRYAFDQAAHGASYQTIREGLDLMEKQEKTGVSWSKNRNRVPILLKTIAYTGDYITDRYHHYMEPDDGMNTQHTTNPVESLNNEIHEDTAHNKILHDDFGTNGSSFSEQHSEYFKSYDSFGKETTQGADCCDSESLEDDPVDDTLRFRLEDEIADDFEQDAKLSVAYRFRCFLHAAYDIIIAPSYRIPKKVKKIRVYPDNCFFGVCPRCNNSIDREYQDFCNCCGQRLDWSKLDEAEVEQIGRNRK